MDALELREGWLIPTSDFQVRFVRSSGPGGQNVNKVSTKVELRFLLEQSAALSEGHKARLCAAFPSAVTRAGEFIIHCDETRSQAMNLEAARERLKSMLLSTRLAPAIRRPTRPSRGAKQRRLTAKHQRSDIKKQRSGPES